MSHIILQRFMEAEHAYEEVLKLDKQCVDAEQEVHSVRLRHLMVWIKFRTVVSVLNERLLF